MASDPGGGEPPMDPPAAERGAVAAIVEVAAAEGPDAVVEADVGPAQKGLWESRKRNKGMPRRASPRPTVGMSRPTSPWRAQELMLRRPHWRRWRQLPGMS